MPSIFYQFRSVNNVDDPSVLGRYADARSPVLTDLVEAVNVDLGNKLEADVRQGFVQAYSGTPHSGWATADGKRSFFVEGGVLKEFDGSTATTLVSLSTDEPCEFCEANNVIIYSNATDIGYIDSTGANEFTEPAEVTAAADTDIVFKAIMPAGHLLAFYNGSLWVAHDNVVTRSDAYDLMARDERYSDIPLPGEVTMLTPVDDGLWVSDGRTAAFIQEGETSYLETAPYGAILGTAVEGKAEWLGVQGVSGKVVVWRSARGVCVGGNGGRFLNLSEDTVALKGGDLGAAMLRHANGQIHYVSTVRQTDDAYNPHVDAGVSVNTVTIT
jgi:hypothetical protein